MEDNTTNNDKITYTKEEIEKMQSDITAAKSNLISEATKKEIELAKSEARKEAEKEMITNQKIKEQETLIEDLKKAKTDSEKEFSDKFKSMEDKLNDMTASRAPASNTNPFASGQPTLPKDSAEAIAHMTDERVNEIEKESGEAFLGEEFIRPI